MKKRKGKFIYGTAVVLILSLILLSGCGTGEPKASGQAYYVISEELDVKKTTDKAQEILENQR